MINRNLGGIYFRIERDGKVFNFNDFEVVCEKSKYSEDKHEYIVCKHYPKCDGTLIDMIEIDNKEISDD